MFRLGGEVVLAKVVWGVTAHFELLGVVHPRDVQLVELVENGPSGSVIVRHVPIIIRHTAGSPRDEVLPLRIGLRERRAVPVIGDGELLSEAVCERELIGSVVAHGDTTNGVVDGGADQGANEAVHAAIVLGVVTGQPFLARTRG